MIGAGGGIGSALVEALATSGRFTRVHALSRNPRPERDRIAGGFVDVADEASIREAAGRIGAPLDLVLIATGILHEDGRMPEKALPSQTRDQALETLSLMQAINPDYIIPGRCTGETFIAAAMAAMPQKVICSTVGASYTFRAG